MFVYLSNTGILTMYKLKRTTELSVITKVEFVLDRTSEDIPAIKQLANTNAQGLKLNEPEKSFRFSMFDHFVAFSYPGQNTILVYDMIRDRIRTRLTGTGNAAIGQRILKIGTTSHTRGQNYDAMRLVYSSRVNNNKLMVNVVELFDNA